MTQSWIHFVIEHFSELTQKIYEQLFLAGSGIIFALLISIPLGIFIAKNSRIRGPVLATVNILQTIPSLAVLAFLIPLVGIGVKPAIITLTIYALLPVVRNTTTGILSIPSALIEAADSLGLTPWQKLIKVELPLAFPVMMVGIRTATTLCVGTATLAAFVGGGGLGDFIYQGLSLNNNGLILLGAVPAALLVLVLDFLLAQFEQTSIKRKKQVSVSVGIMKKIAFSVLLVLFLIKPVSFFWATCQHNVVRIGARSSAEQLIMGEMIAQLLEKKTHLNVVRKFNFVSAGMASSAIINNQVDITPEYTGTAYITTLHGDILNRPKDFYGYIKSEYHRKFHLEWLSPFGFSDNNALVVKKALADRYHLNSITDLKNLSAQWKIALPSDFFLRDDGYKGMHEQYGLNFANVKLMETGLLFSAIHNHQVDIAMGSSTDGKLQAENLVVLEDNKHVFPDYSAAPIVRENVLADHPEIVSVLAPILGSVTEDKIRELNYQVDVEKQSVCSVVKRFLASL